MNETSTIAIIGILGSTVGALIYIIKYLFTTFKPVLDRLVEVTHANTEATKNADAYLQQRNGRDIEFHKDIMAKLQAIPLKAEGAATIVAEELKNQTEVLRVELDKQNILIVDELHKIVELTAERIEQGKKQSEHQVIVEQTVEKQIIK